MTQPVITCSRCNRNLPDAGLLHVDMITQLDIDSGIAVTKLLCHTYQDSNDKKVKGCSETVFVSTAFKAYDDALAAAQAAQ